jgi:RimJ/RimL family protein N-acetyltransferase
VEPTEIRVDELLVRHWRPADAAAVTRAWADPVLRHWSRGLPDPYTIEDGREFTTTIAPRAFTARTDFSYAVTDIRTGELLGSVAVHNPDTRPELGYWSAPWARGRRVTERASRPLLRWALDELDARQVEWKATVGNHASRLTGLRLGFRPVGRLPATAKVPEQWLSVLLPGDLTAAGAELDPVVRRQARVFGSRPPTLDAGPVHLRPPRPADRAGLVAAQRDPEVIRWSGGPGPYSATDATRYVEHEAPLDWARGTEATFTVAGPDDAYAGTADLRICDEDAAVGEIGYLIAPYARGRGWAVAAVRALTVWGFGSLGLARIQWRAEVGNEASRRVAEKAGFTMEGLVRSGLSDRGRRRSHWIGSLLPGDLRTGDLRTGDAVNRDAVTGDAVTPDAVTG